MDKEICVVLSSYNGENYIEEQLDSIKTQSFTDFYVSVCDDCSTDATPEIVKSYIENFSPEWFFAVNGTNRGWKQNFYDLLTSARGDYVFPCDQDDIWMSNKIERMIAVMEEHPEINVLASDVKPFSEEGGSIHSGCVSCPEGLPDMSGLRHITFNAWSLYVHRPGCAYCVRRKFIETIKPYWNTEWPHDAVLWYFAAATKSLAILEEPLVHFRRHNNNASNRKKLTSEIRFEDMQEFLDMFKALECYGAEIEPLDLNVILFLEQAEDWFSARKDFLSTRSISALEKMLKYRSFYATNKGFFVDLILGCNRRAAL